MKDWRHYKKKTYTQNEARKMDYELDLIHSAITEYREVVLNTIIIWT